MIRILALAAISAVSALAERPPNIVVILADDLGIVDVGSFAVKLGSVPKDELYYETPRIDALAREGVAFSQAYANQLCSPTRAAILTGQIASRLGFTTATPLTKTYYNQGLPVPDGSSPHDAFAHADNIPGSLAWINGHSNTAVPTNIPTMPGVIASHDSAFLGKWHVGGHGAAGHRPSDFGFEEIAWLDAGGSAYFNWRNSWNNRNLPSKKFPEDVRVIGRAGEPTGENYLTDDLTVQAVRFLKKRAKTPEKPFLLYFCEFAVHTPIQGKKELVKHFETKPQRGKHNHDNPTYAAMVKSLDESVGAIIDTLRDTGLDENTIVVFFSDNGGVEYTDPAATDNAPFKGGKACLHEGGVRVPLIVWGKNIASPGRWSDQVVDCTDILPTLAELTGNKIPSNADGKSIVPLLTNPNAEWPERTLIWHYPFNVIVEDPSTGHPLTPHSAIRVGPHKLIWDWQGRLELYDIPADQFEKNNLAATEPELAGKLHSQLKDWLRENVADVYFPTPNPDYKPEEDARTPFKNLWIEK